MHFLLRFAWVRVRDPYDSRKGNSLEEVTCDRLYTASSHVFAVTAGCLNHLLCSR